MFQRMQRLPKKIADIGLGYYVPHIITPLTHST